MVGVQLFVGLVLSKLYGSCAGGGIAISGAGVNKW